MSRQDGFVNLGRVVVLTEKKLDSFVKIPGGQDSWSE